MSSPVLYAFLAVLAVTALLLLLRLGIGLRWYRKFRSPAVVTCPETRQPAGVEIDAWHVALGAVRGPPQLRLRDCSRWAERGPCGQPCLSQIESAPEDCLVRDLVRKWYEGKRCIYCREPILALDGLQHYPALRDNKGRTVQWVDVPAENLPQVLATFLPVCWKCHTISTFRREYPHLVLDRPRW